MVVDDSLVYYYDIGSDLCVYSDSSTSRIRNLARPNDGDDAIDCQMINSTKEDNIVIDKSRYFVADGTDEYLRSTIADNPNINTRLNLTIGAWAKILDGDPFAVVSKYSQYIIGLNSLDRPAFLVNIQGDGWRPTSYNNDIWGDNTIDITDWHYWVGTYNVLDGSGGEIKFYCDGNLLVTHAISAGNSNGQLRNDSSGEVKFMRRDSGTGDYQKGGIAIMHCYTRPLSWQEIRQNYIATRGRFQ